MAQNSAWYELYQVVAILKESGCQCISTAVLLILMDKIQLINKLKEPVSEGG